MKCFKALFKIELLKAPVLSLLQKNILFSLSKIKSFDFNFNEILFQANSIIPTLPTFFQ